MWSNGNIRIPLVGAENGTPAVEKGWHFLEISSAVGLACALQCAE